MVLGPYGTELGLYGTELGLHGTNCAPGVERFHDERPSIREGWDAFYPS